MCHSSRKQEADRSFRFGNVRKNLIFANILRICCLANSKFLLLLIQKQVTLIVEDF